MRHWYRRAATGAVLTVCLAIGPAPSATAAPPAPPVPAGDEFYVPPNPLPAGEPGDVVRSRATGERSWQVMYLSTNALGEPDVVTGTVLVPRGVEDLSTVPILAYAVGTQGPAFRCVASKALAGGYSYERGPIDAALARGWAVAVTDYEGYRPDGIPTYIVGRSEGPAVLDSVRAAQRLDEAGLGTDVPVAVQGYSQGGGAGLWAAELAPTYAPELDLVGAAVGGVPADLVATAKQLDGNVGFGFLAFAAFGLDAAYPELDLDSFLNESGRTTFQQARNDCAPELLLLRAGGRIAQYTTSDPLQDPRWQARLAENALGQSPPQVPVYQYHGALDQIVPPAQARALYATYCAAGVPTTWKTYEIAEHISGALVGSDEAQRFLAARIAGDEAPSTC